MYNSCNFVGRLIADPKRFESDGISRCVFSLAVDRDNKREDGGYDSDFLDFVAWKGVGDFVFDNFHKGDMMIIGNARAQVRMYDDSDGVHHRRIEFLVDRVYYGQPKKREEELNKVE